MRTKLSWIDTFPYILCCSLGSWCLRTKHSWIIVWEINPRNFISVTWHNRNIVIFLSRGLESSVRNIDHIREEDIPLVFHGHGIVFRHCAGEWYISWNLQFCKKWWIELHFFLGLCHHATSSLNNYKVTSSTYTMVDWKGEWNIRRGRAMVPLLRRFMMNCLNHWSENVGIGIGIGEDHKTNGAYASDIGRWWKIKYDRG